MAHVKNSPVPEKIYTCKECYQGVLYLTSAEGDPKRLLCRLCRGHGKYEKELTDRQVRIAKYYNELLRKNPDKEAPYLELPMYG